MKKKATPKKKAKRKFTPKKKTKPSKKKTPEEAKKDWENWLESRVEEKRREEERIATVREFLVKSQTEEHARAKHIRAASKEVQEYLKKGGSIPQILAGALEIDRCPSLALEWTMDHFWGRRVVNALPRLELIHAKLVELGITEEKANEFNDGENTVFYIPAPVKEEPVHDGHDDPLEEPSEPFDRSKRIVVSTSQNLHFIAVWSPPLVTECMSVYDFHLRRWWQGWSVEDEWDEETDLEYKDGGIVHAIQHADWLTQYYHDCYPENKYPDRYSLQWYKDHNFEMEYGDCRDGGYVGSLERMGGAGLGNRIGHAHISHGLLKIYFEIEVGCFERSLGLRAEDDYDDD